ncbi:hypothetical protein V5799_008527, partial [Amblyomma americanum]
PGRVELHRASAAGKLPHHAAGSTLFCAVPYNAWRCFLLALDAGSTLTKSVPDSS